jgi:hypothetical protein
VKIRIERANTENPIACYGEVTPSEAERIKKSNLSDRVHDYLIELRQSFFWGKEKCQRES